MVGDGSENPELLELWMFTEFERGCKYCGSKDDMHVDHIVPFDGVDDPRRLDESNLQLLCGGCKSVKAKGLT
jgi:5-methylcytosine-specific restriction endonuclease McrA